MSKPLVPRNWKMTQAVYNAKKRTLAPTRPLSSKEYPCFNGSQNSRRNKKRPITLPALDKGS